MMVYLRYMLRYILTLNAAWKPIRGKNWELILCVLHEYGFVLIVI